MSFWQKGGAKDPKFSHALPVFSVNTLKEAKQLRVLTCSMTWDNGGYVLNWDAGFRGNESGELIQELDKATEYLKERYELITRRDS